VASRRGIGLRARVAGVLAVVGGTLYFSNASWLARPPVGAPTWLAHRGQHQAFSREGLANDTCTAAQSLPQTHPYLENTLASMRAAFDAGASVVELDVRRTSDAQLVVFHDERLECRTNGTGAVRERPLEYLRSLDVGYGYTSDGGKTFPLRGTGVGELRSLPEVLAAFPDKRFLIHIKDGDVSVGDQLAASLSKHSSEQRARWMVYGSDGPVKQVLQRLPDLRGLTGSSLKACMVRYGLLGWSGYMPEACRHTFLLLARNWTWIAWGFPHRFVARFAEHDTEVFLVGANSGHDWLSGIDADDAMRAACADHYSGGIWTDRIEGVRSACPTDSTLPLP
jgi:glycerophosphoryl diester phosphodiesterase